MKKYYILFLLCLLPLFAQANPVLINGIYYNLNGTEAEVTYGEGDEGGNNSYSGVVNIPENFYYPETGITYCVTSIGEWAFYNCRDLITVTIPDGVTEIGESAFYNCSNLNTVTIPNSVTEIGESAFEGCSSLNSITIPNSVTSIGNYAFYDCSGLTSITVASGNTVYDSRGNCNAIIETSSNTLVTGCKNTVIPGSVTSIGDAAFVGSDLTSITIPNSVTSIGVDAFYGSGLTSITIPNSVTDIGFSAFGYCSSLTSITVASGNTVYDSRDNCNAIIETSSNTLVVGCKNTVIPGSVTSIGFGAFFDCASLTSITIPNSVTHICDDAFGYCSGLSSVTIPNSVTSIGGFAFTNCSGLTSVTIGDGVYGIDSYAFYLCSSLTSVTIGNGVKKIGDAAFHSCSNLKHVYCYAENVPSTGYYPWEDNIFENINIQSATLHVPESALEAYSTTSPWSGFGNIVPLGTVPTGLMEVASMPVQVKSRGGVITVEGLDNNTPVTVYTADGALVGTATAVNHTATIPTRLMPGSVAIVKMGGKKVKMVVR